MNKNESQPTHISFRGRPSYLKQTLPPPTSEEFNVSNEDCHRCLPAYM